MFTIYIDGILAYDDVSPDESLKVVSPKLVLGENSAGSFEMTVPPTNVAYDEFEVSLEALGHAPVISIFKESGNDPYWVGRILSVSTDFWNCKKVTCEGVLGYLNDTILTQKLYSGKTGRQVLSDIIDRHNEKVELIDNNKKFTLGITTIDAVALPDFYTDYESALTAIMNKLVAVKGGRIQVRFENGYHYIDWLVEYEQENSQQIEFGVNLFDFSTTMSNEDYCTVVIPRGEKLDKEHSPYEDLTSYVTVKTVNNGNEFVYLTREDLDLPAGSPTPLTNFGWLESVQTWDNITNPAALLNQAKNWLRDRQFDRMELVLSAFDMNYASEIYSEIKLGDSLRVVSTPHGLDHVFPVTKLEIPLDSPEATIFTLGSSVNAGIASRSNSNTKKTDIIMADLPSEQRLTDQLRREAAAMINAATTGYINIIQNAETGAEEFVVSNTPNYLEATKIWRWTMGGLGYSSHGYDTDEYELALTADGQINANLISTGVLAADIIKAGILSDQVDGSNFWFNLDTGEYHIGAIDEIEENYVSYADVTQTSSEFNQTMGSIYQNINDASNVNLVPGFYSSENTDGVQKVLNGITWTANADGSITANGTATNGNSWYSITGATLENPVPVIYLDPDYQYTLSGCPANGGDSENPRYYIVMRCKTANEVPSDSGGTVYCDYGSGVTTSANGHFKYAQIYLLIRNGITVNNLKWYPMLEKGTIKHAFTSPRNGSFGLEGKIIETQTSIKQTADTIRLEASKTYTTMANTQTINLVPSVYSTESGARLPLTRNGITWTVNSDGSIHAEGTATADETFYITGSLTTSAVPRIPLDITKSYTYSGYPEELTSSPGSYSTTFGMFIRMYKPDGSYDNRVVTFNDRAKIFQPGYVSAYLRIVMYSGYSCPSGGLTFKPQLEVGETAHEYQSTHNGTGALDTRLKAAEASITVNANNIELKVSQTDYNGATIASKINQSASSVVIEANHISLAGKTIDLTSDTIAITSTNFSVTKAGKIMAKSGTIGGWTINSTTIYGGTSSTGIAAMQIPQSSTTYVFVAGATSNSDYSTAPFRVTKAGKLYATNAIVTGEVNATTLTSTNASITGGRIELVSSADDDSRIVIRRTSTSDGKTYSVNISGMGISIPRGGSSAWCWSLNGNTGFQLWNPNGGSGGKYLWLTINGVGTIGNENQNSITWSPTGVSRAYTTYGDIAQTGRDVTNSIATYVSVETQTYKAITSVQLPTVGHWLLVGNVQFTSNSTGSRWAAISTVNNGSTVVDAEFSARAAASGRTSGTLIMYVKPSSAETTYYLNVWHNAGQNITVSGSLKAVRIS